MKQRVVGRSVVKVARAAGIPAQGPGNQRAGLICVTSYKRRFSGGASVPGERRVIPKTEDRRSVREICLLKLCILSDGRSLWDDRFFLHKIFQTAIP